MRTLSQIAIAAALVGRCAYGQATQAVQVSQTAAPAQTNASPQEAPATPGSEPASAPILRAPAPSAPLPLSQDIQAAMANSQLQTYRYNQLTEQALALKKLCETGFGPTDICPKPTASAPGAIDIQLAADANALPVVAEINGAQNALSAVLVLGDGRHVTVHTGSILPGGLKVATVTADDVRVTRGNGPDATLPFGGSPK